MNDFQRTRIYLDYNATSPLSLSVLEHLRNGDVSFCNPSSGHTSGKLVRRLINEKSQDIYHYFALEEKAFKLFFTSGATESINTILRGLTSDWLFCYCLGDHSAVTETVNKTQAQKLSFAPTANGDFPLSDLIQKINQYKKQYPNNKILVNFTFVHNESGVVWPLSLARELKEKTGAYIHVDAAQAIGKILNIQEDLSGMDVITFSGHKFGGLKGTGFTFVSNSFPFSALITGGHQQNGMRSGTENPLAVVSLVHALSDVKSAWDYMAMQKLRDELEALLPSHCLVIGKNSEYGRASNTLYFVHPTKKSDELLIYFDLAGLDVSMGAACQSDSSKASPYLLSMGLISYAMSGIRLSLGPDSIHYSSEIKKIFSDKIIPRL